MTGERAPDEQHAAERARRRAQVFGEVLPETTSDERGDVDGGAGDGGEEWLRANVPPHHGT